MKSLVLLFAVFILPGVALGQAAGTMTIKVYFHNEKLNPNMQDCTKVFPTYRTIPKTKAVATAALEELFKGTTKEEEAKEFGFFTPEETKGILKSVNVKAGGAYVNFTNAVYEQMGTATTSCGGGFFPAIEKTLLQFPTIKKVYYAVEGDTNGFYEWVQVGECPHGKKHCAKSNFK